ncbi:MAG: TonB-dependent receptor [Curvibacter sp.]|nr:MAG: TonB-dependent receptor [Curvibacter sp.]
MSRPWQILPLLSCLAAPGTWAQPALPQLAEIRVSAGDAVAPGEADSASEGRVTAQRLARRPLLRPADLMESVPGLVVTQHSGDGKANQYFLRGFNLDHGSDFATSLMGMPVNLVSHAHGQGYMDLNFLIPELVSSLQYRKGVYHAEDADFAVAGSARIDYMRQLPAPFVELGLGPGGYRRSLLADSRLFDDKSLLMALELTHNNGPWQQPERLGKQNAVLKLSSGTEARGYSISGLLYQADWNATEHVPERAIVSGEIGRYGVLSPGDGGRTHRYSLSAQWADSTDHGARRAHAYVIDYGLNLFSTPSGFVSGLSGDQHEQADQRVLWGGGWQQSWFLGEGLGATELTLGTLWRQDRISNVGLFSTVKRQRTEVVRQDRILETAIGLSLEARTVWTDWLRTSLGLRQDHLQARVTPLAGAFNADNGGDVSARQLSPRLGLVLGPFAALGSTEFFVNAGQGFHSNDARGATSRVSPLDGSAVTPVPLLVKARGQEIGLRAQPLPAWQTRLSVWQMQLASELVFVGDEGVTEPRGASRRWGLEWAQDVQVAPGLTWDGNLAWSKARFVQAVNGGSHVPNAVPLTVSTGLAWDRGGPWFGGLRLRYLGAYDLEETGRQPSRGYWWGSLKLGYRFQSGSNRWQATLDVLNLFDRRANDIEYWGGACSQREALSGIGGCGSGSAIDGRLIHPLEPRTLRLGLRLSF